MFEEGNRLAKLYGRENVFDFSLGNPNVEAPEAVKEALISIVKEEAPLELHGYTNSNAGYEEVRQAVAESLNERFQTEFCRKYSHDSRCSGRLECDFKDAYQPQEEVIVFAPYFGEYRSYTSNVDGVLVEISPDTETSSQSLLNLRRKLLRRRRRLS